MAEKKTVKSTILLRNDTEANWQEKDPILGKGQMAVSVDLEPAMFKIGDGTKKWSEIKYQGIAQDAFNQLKNEVADINGSLDTLGTAAYTNKEDYDAAGTAEAVRGTTEDASTEPTVYGVKAYADEQLALKADKADTYTKAQVDEAINNQVASVLDYKGVVNTKDELPTTDNKIGDTWHVKDTGAEWSWDGEVWQELGTAVDLSDYVHKAELSDEATARETADRNLENRVSDLEQKETSVKESTINGNILVDETREVTAYDITKDELLLDCGNA